MDRLAEYKTVSLLAKCIHQELLTVDAFEALHVSER